MHRRRLLLTIACLLFIHNHGQLAFSQVLPPLSADFNSDGVVNSADYSVWRSNYGTFDFFAFGDANGDGLVDEIDYFEWKSQFGLDLTRVGFGGPTIDIDLIRDGSSRPLLDPNGRWQFSVSIIPDVAGFNNSFTDVPDKGTGSATAIDLGLQINDEHGFTNTNVNNLSAAVSGQIYEDDPTWDGNAVDAFGFDNPGNSPYGGLVDSQGLDAVGHQIDAALGTIYFNSDNGGSGHLLFTFSAGRPAVDASFGGLTIEVDVDGGYGGFYRLTQDFGTFDHPDVNDFFTYAVQVGDVNLDGVVDDDDLSILDGSLGNPGVWTDGDLTGEGIVDGADRSILLTILVPEPVSAVLIGASLCLQAVAIRGRAKV